MSRPISRVLSWTIIHLDNTSPYISSDLPGSRASNTMWRTTASLFGLAPDGVYHATTVTSCAVRSYRTLSPLPYRLQEEIRRSTLCCTFRRLSPPRRYLASRSMEPGLSSIPPQRRNSDCLVNSVVILQVRRVRKRGLSAFSCYFFKFSSQLCTLVTLYLIFSCRWALKIIFGMRVIYGSHDGERKSKPFNDQQR